VAVAAKILKMVARVETLVKAAMAAMAAAVEARRVASHLPCIRPRRRAYPLCLVITSRQALLAMQALVVSARPMYLRLKMTATMGFLVMLAPWVMQAPARLLVTVKLLPLFAIFLTPLNKE
jgi:hypothetical protein